MVSKVSASDVEDRLRERGLLPCAKQIAKAHFVPLAELLGTSRMKSVAAARKLLYGALQAQGLSTTEIGFLLGRDHSTIVCALGKCRFYYQDAAAS